MKATSLLLAGLVSVSAFAFAPTASAQFGPERIAKPDADELYADRAMQQG